MRHHGPACLQGPVSRARPCWQEADDDVPQAPLAGADDELVRWELIDRVRTEIAKGTYDTDERWQAALDRLLREIEGK